MVPTPESEAHRWGSDLDHGEIGPGLKSHEAKLALIPRREFPIWFGCRWALHAQGSPWPGERSMAISVHNARPFPSPSMAIGCAGSTLALPPIPALPSAQGPRNNHSFLPSSNLRSDRSGRAFLHDPHCSPSGPPCRARLDLVYYSRST